MKHEFRKNPISCIAIMIATAALLFALNASADGPRRHEFPWLIECWNGTPKNPAGLQTFNFWVEGRGNMNCTIAYWGGR